MNVEKNLFMLGAVVAATLCHVGFLRAEDICDSFADGNPFDGDPVAWQNPACCRGEFRPIQDGIEVINPGGLNAIDAPLLSQQSFTGDLKVRIRASFNNTENIPNVNDSYPEIAAVLHASLGPNMYYGSVIRDGTLVITKWPQHTHVFGHLGFEPADGDLHVELARCGSTLELRVWSPDGGRSDGGRPQEPQVTRIDDSYHSGIAGFSGASYVGNHLILRSICITTTPSGASFRRGDCNDDGNVDIADAVSTLGSLFLGHGDPDCDDACDSNDDGAVDILDAINTLGLLFLGEGQIPFPGVNVCGIDRTDDGVGCDGYEQCP